MRNTLFEGDRVLVNKFFLNTPSRFDVVVFDPPVKDSVYGEIDSYIKRCVGVPGDTIRIISGVTYVNGISADIPGVQYSYRVIRSGASTYAEFMTPAKADSLRISSGVLSVQLSTDPKIWFDPNVFPFKESLGWNLDHWGPVVVPGSGWKMPLDEHHVSIYKGLIELFEKHTITREGGKFLVDGMPKDFYEFENDHYWVMGDNRHASSDSRNWGFVPAKNIRGTASHILWSKDPLTDSSRSDRRLIKIQ